MEMERNITELALEEFDTICEIWPNPKNPEGFAKRMELWRRLIAEGKRTIFIYKEEKRCVGEAALMFDMDDPDYTLAGIRVCLVEMTVASDCRNKGIGAQLIRHACAYAKEKGYTQMTLGVDLDNAPARHLYDKMGFTHIIRESEDADGKYLKLCKDL